MAPHTIKRIAQAVARAAQRRDEIEMQGIDRLLSPLARKRVRPAMTAAAITRISRTGFRAILCPVDFSEQSRVALRYAATLAARSGGRLTILYVNDPLLIAAAGIALHDRSLATRTLVELRRFVAATVPAALVASGQTDARVASGQPADQIPKAALRDQSDLIVMGTNGLTGATKLFMGSTTSGVLRRTSVPVLAIPRAARGKLRPGTAAAWPGTRIIAAIELSRHAERDTRAAAAVAAWFGSTLLLVHVVPEFKATAWLRRRIEVSDRARIADARSRMATLARGLGRATGVETRVLFGEAAGELASVAATEGVGLVVMTLRTPRGLVGSPRGSISYAVLAQVAAPVLALPG
ncbi:MAG: universal stress protein [Acidobacteriota bacterium]